MDGRRGNSLGDCTLTTCVCKGYVPSGNWKCRSCGHHPDLHKMSLRSDKLKGSHSSANYKYSQQAMYTPGQYVSSQSVTQTRATSSREWPSSIHHQAHVPSHRCIVCSNAAYYDAELMKQFDYCSGDCRDQHLLIKNVQDIKNDIAKLELAVKVGGSLDLPKTKSGGKTNCHKCDSNFKIGSTTKDQCSTALGGIKAGKKASPTMDKSKSSPISSDISRRSQDIEYRQGAKPVQNTIQVKVSRKHPEGIGIFLSSAHLSDLHRCIITGYKCKSPIAPHINSGEIHLLDAIVKVNEHEFKKYMEFDRLILDSRSVNLLCIIQNGCHVPNLRGLGAPDDVTHVFALRCSQANNTIGIDVSRHIARVTNVSRKSIAEESGIRPKDSIKMFVVMLSSGHQKPSEKCSTYSNSEFVEKLKEAFKEVSSSRTTIILFINRL